MKSSNRCSNHVTSKSHTIGEDGNEVLHIIYLQIPIGKTERKISFTDVKHFY